MGIVSCVNNMIHNAFKRQTDPVHNQSITIPLIPEISMDDFRRRVSRCLGRQCGKTTSNLKKCNVVGIDIEVNSLRTADEMLKLGLTEKEFKDVETYD